MNPEAATRGQPSSFFLWRLGFWSTYPRTASILRLLFLIYNSSISYSICIYWSHMEEHRKDIPEGHRNPYLAWAFSCKIYKDSLFQDNSCKMWPGFPPPEQRQPTRCPPDVGLQSPSFLTIHHASWGWGEVEGTMLLWLLSNHGESTLAHI